MKAKISLILVLLSTMFISGCERKAGEIVDSKYFKFEVTEIAPPKHYRVRGKPINEAEFSKWYSIINENSSTFYSGEPILLYSSKHCSTWRDLKIGAILSLKVVKYNDGEIKVLDDSDIFCK